MQSKAVLSSVHHACSCTAKERPGRIRPSGWTTRTRGAPPRCSAKDSRCSSCGRRTLDTTATARPKREPRPSKCLRATRKETPWWGRHDDTTRQTKVLNTWFFFFDPPCRWTCCYACKRQQTTRARRAATATAPVTTTNNWTPRWSRRYDGDAGSLVHAKGGGGLRSSCFPVQIWKVLLCKMVHPMTISRRKRDNKAEYYVFYMIVANPSKRYWGRQAFLKDVSHSVIQLFIRAPVGTGIQIHPII